MNSKDYAKFMASDQDVTASVSQPRLLAFLIACGVCAGRRLICGGLDPRATALENMLTENASRPDLRGYWWASEPPSVRAGLADQALRTPPIATASRPVPPYGRAVGVDR